MLLSSSFLAAHQRLCATCFVGELEHRFKASCAFQAAWRDRCRVGPAKGRTRRLLRSADLAGALWGQLSRGSFPTPGRMARPIRATSCNFWIMPDCYLASGDALEVDRTERLVAGGGTISVQVLTRSLAWLSRVSVARRNKAVMGNRPMAFCRSCAACCRS
jgi:hypothetical protein